MSSRWAPAGVTARGIFDADPGGDIVNEFRGYNMVRAYYCSSDNWTGDTTIVAVDDSGTYPEYTIHNRGHRIVTAMMEALREGVTSDDGSMTLPSIDDADLVIFSGTSAGSGGARSNADRVGELLRDANPDLRYRLVTDAGFHPRVVDPPEITEDDFAAYLNHVAVVTDFRGASYEASCEDFHGDDPRICGGNTHLALHHIETPWFAKMDLTDPVNSPGGYDTPQGFSRAVLETFEGLATLEPEEGFERDLGAFVPNCGHHVNLSTGLFYTVRIGEPGNSLSFHDVLHNWIEGTGGPTVVIDGPDDALQSICP